MFLLSSVWVSVCRHNSAWMSVFVDTCARRLVTVSLPLSVAQRVSRCHESPKTVRSFLCAHVCGNGVFRMCADLLYVKTSYLGYHGKSCATSRRSDQSPRGCISLCDPLVLTPNLAL